MFRDLASFGERCVHQLPALANDCEDSKVRTESALVELKPPAATWIRCAFCLTRFAIAIFSPFQPVLRQIDEYGARVDDIKTTPAWKAQVRSPLH